MQGLPGIYIHSLLGSRNDYYGKSTSGILRRINREKLQIEELEKALEGESNRRIIFEELLRRLKIRAAHPAFAPDGLQRVLSLDKRVFALERESVSGEEKITVYINVSGENVKIKNSFASGLDILSGEKTAAETELKPYECKWFV